MSFQSATPDGPKNTGSDSWATPQWIIDKLGGPFDLDPCQFLVNGSPLTRTANRYFTLEVNGLAQDWNYPEIFVNFPYSEAKDWLDKCSAEHKKWGCDIVVLCFARTETKAQQTNLKNATGINLLNRRIKFLDSCGAIRGNGNAPSMLIAYGERAYTRIKRVDGVCFRRD